jgi:hypothetical protein
VNAATSSRVSQEPIHRGRRMKLALLVLCAMAAMNIIVVWNSRHSIEAGHSDFISFYSAGELLRSGRASELFDPDTQFAVQSRHSPFVRERRQPFPYIHPPIEALLFVPFSYLPYPAAYVAWTGLNLLVLITTVGLLRKQLPDLAALPRIWWAPILLAFFPFITVLVQGQDDLLLLFFFALVFLGLKRGRNVAAGMCLGLALIRPQFALPLAAILFCAGEWGAFCGFLAVAAALSVATVAIFGWSAWLNYPSHVWSSEQISNPNGVLLGSMPNLHGLLGQPLAAALSPGLLSTLILILSAAALILALSCWRRGRSLEMSFSAVVLCVLLVSYHSFAPDLVLLLLPGFLCRVVREEFRTRSWLWLLPALLLVPPLSYVLVRYQRFNVVAIALLLWLLAISVSAVHGNSLRNSSPHRDTK